MQPNTCYRKLRNLAALLRGDQRIRRRSCSRADDMFTIAYSLSRLADCGAGYGQVHAPGGSGSPADLDSCRPIRPASGRGLTSRSGPSKALFAWRIIAIIDAIASML